jgi:hypothetical protein
MNYRSGTFLACIPIAAVFCSAAQCHAQSYKITTIAGGGTNRGTDGLGDDGAAMMATLPVMAAAWLWTHGQSLHF